LDGARQVLLLTVQGDFRDALFSVAELSEWAHHN
jgi:hypothetical protein